MNAHPFLLPIRGQIGLDTQNIHFLDFGPQLFEPMAVYDVDKLMLEARKLAANYRRATGKALGISSEIATHDVIRLMKLVPAEPGAGGYDAIGTGSREGKYIQIKGRTLFKDQKSGQRIGQIKLEQEWDSIMLILMGEDYEPRKIYEADREEIIEAVAESSAKRAKRGAMTVARFKAIGARVWCWNQDQDQDEGETPDEQAL